MWWFQRGLCVLPVALMVWSSVTLLLSYTTAVLLGHADLLVPYISDTGTEVPERCVFGFMLTIAAFLGLATIYARYKQVEALISVSESGLRLLNYMGLLLGFFSTAGMCIIANFQKTDLTSIHLLGAGMTFGSGLLYVLLQTGVSYRMQPRFHGRAVLCARIAVTSWALLSIITLFISSVLLYDELLGEDVTMKLHWQPRDRGFVARQVSAAAEWSLAFSFICFFSTYIRDFQKMNLRIQPVLQSTHLYDYPPYEERRQPGRPQHEERSPLLAASV